MFSTSDFTLNSVYGRIQSLIGLRRDQRWRFPAMVRLACAIVVPIAIFSAVTRMEGVFFPGSVVTDGRMNGKACQLVGMSFLGDPMAWGFMILVPVLIAVLKMATDRTIRLVNTVAEKASDAWKQDTSPGGLAAVVRNTHEIWKLKARKPRKRIWLALYLPWIIAVVLWLYNTLTCAFYPRLPASYYPYRSKQVKLMTSTSSKPVVQAAAENPAGSKDTGVLQFNFEGQPREARLAEPSSIVQSVFLAEPIPLKKWDCQRSDAPLSCWLTRIWTLFYYGAVPFLLRHLVLLIWGATCFLNAGTRWEEGRNGEKVQAIEINPFHPDGFGGLGALSDSVIGYLYSVSCFALLLGLSFLKEGNQPAWHDYAMMLFFLPLGVWGVLAPSVAVRHTIVNAKNRYLGQLAKELHAVGNTILQALPAGTLSHDLRKGELDKQQKAMRGLYDDVKHMSEWPFSMSTLLRMIFPLAAPWLPAILKEVAKGYIK